MVVSGATATEATHLALRGQKKKQNRSWTHGQDDKEFRADVEGEWMLQRHRCQSPQQILGTDSFQVTRQIMRALIDAIENSQVTVSLIEMASGEPRKVTEDTLININVPLSASYGTGTRNSRRKGKSNEHGVHSQP